MGKSVYEIVTEQILEQLDKGVIPWRKPWAGGGEPANFVSKKAYRGINTWLLACSKYASPYWLTFNQVKDKGGNVRKGEKSSLVVFWKGLEVEDKDHEGKVKTVPMLRYYRVFNVEQCDGLKVPETETKEHDTIPECEALVGNMPMKPEVHHGGGRACYIPSEDRVNVPALGLFNSPEEYYSTLFHELVHATGHDSRLGRHKQEKCSHAFGSVSYSQEELVAEMGAAFLCNKTGIGEQVIENQAAYINNWRRKIGEDPKLVVFAASKAQKAADFIQGKMENVQE